MIRKCTGCGVVLSQRYKIKYCSNKCQADFQYKLFINNWKDGLEDGVIGKDVKSLSRHLRRYLADKNGERCFYCGWNEKHPITGKVTLEIDHIDGNAENNEEGNLRLLCPNCHSLTPYFRNLNRGNGRKWRMDKYKKQVATQPIF
ncbi:MAG: HNH endonuclease signature motif containing protein [Candidatus Paceibacterota bacterium]|jgi:hypothetical protein